jgi:A/G-specific adenine glycosylase
LRDFDTDLPTQLLQWYDRHARALPWRVPPRAGVRPEPYHVWLSEIMLQQTTVAAVKSYFETFVRRWPTVADLAAAEDSQVMAAWAGLGYYARARNLLKCARTVAGEMGGVFPDTEAALQKLPGIGPYTSAAIAAIAFDRRATVLDGNVERVMARLHAVEAPLPASKESLRRLAAALTPAKRAGDYAQAVMDLGATVCTPTRPACGLCPWAAACDGRARGIAADLPRKLPKRAKPVRVGIAYVARREDGALLLEQRPGKGLLGGMLGWPGSDWTEVPPDDAPPLEADWLDAGAEVRHTFTHFHLRLKVLRAEVAGDARPLRGAFVAAEAFDPDHLPTVMRKVWALVEAR